MKSQSKVIDDQVFNLMDVLRSPILTHDQAWADAIPQRILSLITISRLKSILLKEEHASDPEVVAFMMTRVMEAPMTHDWVEIYTYISCKVCKDYFQEDHAKEVQAPETLTDYQENHLLMPLRRFIYDKRRKALKERMKSEKKAQIPVIDVTQETEILPNIVKGHYTLWDS